MVISGTLPLLFALAACAPSGLEESEKRPDDVKPGMSLRQVEALVGQSFETCWEYDRGGGAHERACFRDRMVNVYAKTTREPGSNDLFVDAVLADVWLPKPPPASATSVSLGMSPEQVTRLLGKPQTVVERYSVAGGMNARFVDGKLTTFEAIPRLPVH